MKKMTTEEVYTFAKMLLPKGRESRMFGLVYEIHNGLLIGEVLEGDATAAEAPNLVLAGAYACLLEGESSTFMVKIFEIVEDYEALILEMAEKIEALPVAILTEDKGDLNAEYPPEVAAAFVACQDKDGKRSYLLYRHPQIDRDRAILLVKATLRYAAEYAIENEKRELNEN